MKEKKGKFRLRRALFPAGYYAANSVYQGYISLYYTRLGFSGGQLGAISASAALASIFAQPLWGLLADRMRRQKLLLAVLALLAALSLLPALAGKGFAAQLGAAALFYAFFCALLPLGDAILLETEGSGFGAYRLAGGASFALAGALFGMLRGRLGPGGALWSAGALLAFTAAAALLLPNTAGRQKSRPASAFLLLKDRRLTGMLLFLLPLQMSMACFYTFFAPHFKSLPGGSDALLGLGYLISAVSEAPYLIFSGRIYRRFGAVKPMCMAAAVLAARWLILGLAPSAGAALAGQLLHGGGFIVITVSMAYWIGENAPEELRASGQALLNMVSFGAARIAGNLLGGVLAARLGTAKLFLWGSALCLAALCIFAPMAFIKKKAV